MYIQVNNKNYPCSGYAPEAGIRAIFRGVEGVTLPVTGKVKLCDDSGFVLAEADCADYARQVCADGVLTLTNEPEPPALSTEELLGAARARAFARIDGMCSAAIYSGVIINGKRYGLSKNQQGYIDTAVKAINNGATGFILAAEGEEPALHTAEQIRIIDKAATEWGIVNINYLSKLQKYIKRETDITVLDNIHYGSILPNDLLSELSTLLSSINIDISKYTNLFS